MTTGFAIKFPGDRSRVGMVDRHQFICDLCFIDGPLLSLFRDNRNNWFYLWCDTDGIGRDRWLVFQVTRKTFAEYISGKLSLRKAISVAKELFCLEGDTNQHLESQSNAGRKGRILSKVSVDSIQAYQPSDDSFFDPTYAPDISMAEQLLPTRYSVPIGGDWFVGDLDRFSRAYAGLYGFFYCTKPRLVASIQSKLSRALRAPWEGGFSRVNLFDSLAKTVPSFHDMKIRRIEYASPGQLEIEALDSVGKDIQQCLDGYMSNRTEIDEHAKVINVTLSACRFRRMNLSARTDSTLGISDEQLEVFKNRTSQIANLIGSNQQLATLTNESPNCVVSAKATLALLTHIKRLVEFESVGLLNLTGRGAQAAEYDYRDNWLEEFNPLDEKNQGN